MRKIIFKFGLCITLGLSIAVFNSCGEGNEPGINNGTEQTDPTKPTEPGEPAVTPGLGVKIGNTIWATRNVDAFGTFAAAPQDYGKFYQWNRPTAWNTTEETVSNWDATIPSGDTWEAANDPCPAGWQVPNLEQIEELVNSTTASWTSDYSGTGVKGRIFTEGKNSLFFPAVGYRVQHDVGGLSFQEVLGDYWSSTPVEGSKGSSYTLYFDATGDHTRGKGRTFGHSVRCVASSNANNN